MNKVAGNIVEMPIESVVIGRDGPLGHSTRMVLNPKTDRMTDFVLHPVAPRSKEVLVPRYLINHVGPNSIQVDIAKEDIVHLKPFLWTQYIPVDIPRTYTYNAYGISPYVEPEHHLIPMNRETLPGNELAIQRHAKVIAEDRPVGWVDEVMLDMNSGRMTKLVMREGHFWDSREVLIPVAAITRIGEKLVRLSLTKQQIDQLPHYPPKARLLQHAHSAA